jgi:hypothetical protein
MQPREVGERAQFGHHGSVECHFFAEPLAAVDDPMSHNLGSWKLVAEGAFQLARCSRPPGAPSARSARVPICS